MWAGVWASSDDFNPIIGEFGRRPGLFACIAPTGFTLGPIVTRMLAESMAQSSAGRSGSSLPAAYKPDRTGVLTRK